MKKTLLTLTLALCAAGVMAQSVDQLDARNRQLLQSVHKRDYSRHHLQSAIPLSAAKPANAVGTKDALGQMPEGSLWFPGEWEEVQAIVVTPYYYYLVPGHENDGSWFADPLVEGVADYYYGSFQNHRGTGSYISQIDTLSSFGQVSFYLMDAIQLGGAEAWVRVEQAADTLSVLSHLRTKGLRHDNVRFLVAPGNSFWYRDCGPICFYYGDHDSVAMLDFEYYPGRALDDSLPVYIHRQFGLPIYNTQIEWEGGNCLVDGTGMVFSSDQIYEGNGDEYGQLTWDGSNVNSINYQSKNPLTQANVRDSLAYLIGRRGVGILPAFKHDGGTGHIDLYADMVDENRFVFSVMPTQYQNWEDYATGTANMATLMSYTSLFGVNYTSTSIPFPGRSGGNYFTSETQYENYTRTYSNHTFVNNVIIQPCFTAVGADGLPNSTWDRQNILELQKAYPGYTIYCVNVSEFDGSGGAIHCITKQIPAENPVRILHSPVSGATGNTYLNTAAPISAIITNHSGIASASVVYRVNGGEWQTVSLAAGADNSFAASIPTNTFAATDTVEYYISATSNNGKTMTKPITASQGGYYKFSFADPSGIADVNADSHFGQFYPNPATDRAQMVVSGLDGGRYEVTLFDATGRALQSGTFVPQGDALYTVNTSLLASGSYTVVFRSGSDVVSRRLIVK